jgi:hypothetical protein
VVAHALGARAHHDWLVPEGFGSLYPPRQVAPLAGRPEDAATFEGPFWESEICSGPYRTGPGRRQGPAVILAGLGPDPTSACP